MLELWSDQLDLLVRAGTPLIWIRSPEEERVEALLQQAVSRLGTGDSPPGTSSMAWVEFSTEKAWGPANRWRCCSGCRRSKPANPPCCC